MALAKATPMGARRFVEFRNGVRMCKGSRKAGPSGFIWMLEMTHSVCIKTMVSGPYYPIDDMDLT